VKIQIDHKNGADNNDGSIVNDVIKYTIHVFCFSSKHKIPSGRKHRFLIYAVAATALFTACASAAIEASSLAFRFIAK